jgi:type IV pilus assembly protein PilQ
MFKSGPAHSGIFSAVPSAGWLSIACLLTTLIAVDGAIAQDGAERRLEAIEVQSLPGQRVELRLRMDSAAPEPMSFTIDDPARIALDLPGTILGQQARRQEINLGPVTTALVAEANGRTRVVLNMSAMVPYSTRVEGDSVYIELGLAGGSAPTFAAAQPNASPPAAPNARASAPVARTINNVDFRRGLDGAGQVIVELSDPRTTVDVREEGGRIIVEFQDTALPAELLRRLDVTDFATPVATVDALRDSGDARLVITPSGNFEQVAYQADNLFTLELKTPIEVEESSAGVFDTDKEYVGDPLTLTFQDIDTRAVLQLLGDFSGLNMVVTDTVQGNVTLRLQNVPWDQALDVVMTTKGLDMRRNGNVVIVAPAEEIVAREQAALEAAASIQELEQLRSEFIQVNYAKAGDLANIINGSGGGSNALLSDRGGVAIDQRTNTLLVQDTSERLAEIRRLVTTLDIPVSQVQIEARIVVVNDDYGRELGVRFGSTLVKNNSSDGIVSMTGSSAGSNSIVDSALDNLSTTGQPFPVLVGGIADRYNVNLPVANPAGRIALAILDSDYLVDLELSAIQAEGNGEIYSTPRVITANNIEARIMQGVEIPFQESSSSGATTTSFKEAVLSLTVTPQITPDDRIIMNLLVTKDSVGEVVPSATGGFVPSIDTREVQSTAVVNDGETVVLGGIYETETRDTVSKVPVLGDIPGLGYLFRSRNTVSNKAELLIFVTPRILRDGSRLE